MPPPEVLVSVATAAIAATSYTLFVLLTGLGLLRLVGPVWPERPIGPVALVATAFALGQGVLGNLFQVVAALGAFRPAILAALLALGAAVGLLSLRHGLRIAADPGLSQPAAPLGIGGWLIVGLTGWLGLLFLYLTLHPPMGDAVAYYLAQPKLIAANGRFELLAGYESFSQIGVGSEMHYALFYAFGGDSWGEYAAKMFVGPNAVAIVLLLLAIADRLLLGSIGKALLAAMVVTSSAVTLIVWDGKTDLMPAVLALAAVLWAVEVRRQERAGAALLVGLFTGLAIVGKLSFAVVLPPMIGTIFLWSLVSYARDGAEPLGRVITRGLGAGVVGGALGFLPLMAKNTLVFGEPLAPFFYLGGGASAVLEQSWYAPEHVRWIVLTYPFALVFGSYPMQHGVASPLLLAFLTLLLLVLPALRRPEYRPLVVSAVAAALGLAAWLIVKPSVHAPRYILPAVLMLMPLAAAAAELAAARLGSRLMACAVPAAAIAFLAVTLDSLTRVIDASHPSPLAMTHRYLQADRGEWSHEFWRAAQAMAERGGEGDRVFAANYYTLPLRSDLLACMLRPEEKVGAYRATSAAEFWEALYRAGADFFYIYRPTHEASFGAPIDPAQTPDWLSVTEIPVAELTRVYRLEADGDAPPRDAECRRREDGTFEVAPTMAAAEPPPPGQARR